MIFHDDHFANLHEMSDPIFYENRKMSENKVLHRLNNYEMTGKYSGKKNEISEKKVRPFFF